MHPDTNSKTWLVAAITLLLAGSGCVQHDETDAQPGKFITYPDGGFDRTDTGPPSDIVDPPDAEDPPDADDPPDAIVPPPDVGPPEQPCLTIDRRDSVYFGSETVGETATETFTLENCADDSAQLRIDALFVANRAGGVFSLERSSLPGNLADGGTATLAPGESRPITVEFSPGDARRYSGELLILSNDPRQPELPVVLTGEGREPDPMCPTARAQARVAGSGNWQTDLEVEPEDTLELTGRNSSDPDGSIARYEWSILEQPASATADLSSDDSRDPTLRIPVTGNYRIGLTVYDQDGLSNCGSQATIEVSATSRHDIRIELTWRTPGDPDPDDDDGTDLDLHYLNAGQPGAQWGVDPWGIDYANMTADWGQEGPADDPELAHDVRNGQGPETIDHDQPAAGTTYRVGVHFFGQPFDETYATVRIYHDGNLEFEYLDKRLDDEKMFWTVAEFTGQPNNVREIDETHDRIP